MKISALVSGGKDSIHAASLLENFGWTVEELVTLEPKEPDAMLFHTPNLRWIPLQAKAWGKAHRRVEVEGTGETAELEALSRALAPLKGKHIRGISIGAVASSYQWSRVHAVAHDLGLEVFAPLWRVPAEIVVREEIATGMDIRFSHVATEGLGPELLGQRLDGGVLETMKARARGIRDFNLAGEGGEYETFVVAAPFFRGRISITESHVETRGGASTWVLDGARWTR